MYPFRGKRISGLYQLLCFIIMNILPQNYVSDDIFDLKK